jgi:adenylate kinase family enzyme
MRIVVVGTSGSGKTTMAKALSKRLGLPHVELDGLNWRPGWRDSSRLEPEAFYARVAEAAAGEAWVMDGNYTKVKDAHWTRATVFVWMDTARWTVMRRVLWRSFRRAVSKQELWPGTGNKELFRRWLDREHPIRWAWDTWASNRARNAQAFGAGTYQGRPAYRVVNSSEGRRLIARLAAEQATEALPIRPRWPKL